MKTAKTMLWVTGGMILFMAVVKSSMASAESNQVVINAQLFLFGAFMSIAVWMTIVQMGDESRPDNYGVDKKGVKFLPPKVVYKSQKITAMVICLCVLAPMLAYTAYLGRFAEFGGWLLLPVTAIGPALYLLDYYSRGKARR